MGLLRSRLKQWGSGGGGEANTHSPHSTRDLIILKQYLRQSYNHVPDTELHHYASISLFQCLKH